MRISICVCERVNESKRPYTNYIHECYLSRANIYTYII
jgi:hypothetical protein